MDKEPRREFQHYIEDQVLVVGPEDEIEQVVGQAQERFGVDLKLARDGKADLGRLQWDPSGDVIFMECLQGILPELWECLERPLEMHLYRIIRRHPAIDDPRLVEEVVKFTNEAGAERCVRADLNWLTGYPYSVAGSPYSVAGSPYSVAGSPYSVAGSPYTKHGGPVGPDDFWNQWALERIGLISNGSRNIKCLGHGVRVGVFDTSPFAEEGRPEPARDGHPPQLTVVHPEIFEHFLLPPPPPPYHVGAGRPPDPPDLSSHGLAVAGLAYAVAPRSDIYLYRVLDQYARGNLFVLCHAIIEFMVGVLSDQDAPNGGIINLSLGLDLPDDWQARAGSGSITALDTVLALAHCLGLTVVAAAGNGSPGKRPAADAEFPASQSYALGVMASNYENDRSCFSNYGEVAAPGGDGVDCGRGEDEMCQCPWEAVDSRERWKYGLIGPVLPDRQFRQGFARWIGTSFATPLVSGMAALVREHHGGPSQIGVSGEILGHVNQGGSEIIGGIIDVQGY